MLSGLAFSCPLLLFSAATLVLSTGERSDLDNAVVGSPVVECEREFIHFSVPTKLPFKGRVYVKGEYSNGDCVRIYDLTGDEDRESADVHRNEVNSGGNTARDESNTRDPVRLFNPPRNNGGFANYEHGNWKDFLRGEYPPSQKNGEYQPDDKYPPLACPPCETTRRRRQTKSNSAEIDIRLGTCNVQRDRTLNPAGLRVSAVIVVSFHQSFVTKIDKSYRVDCLYEESNRQVTTKIDVSMPPIVELNSEMQTPKCEYRIKAQNGADLKNVRVGEEVIHEWNCRPAQSSQLDHVGVMNEMFAILVHSCFVDDGQGKKQLVVDNQGCSMDNFIMPTPSYEIGQLKASVAAPVVKFPDRDVVGFQCAISVHMKDVGTSPPKCDGPHPNRTRRFAVDSKDGWRLHAQQLTVLDPETSAEERQDLDKLLNSQLSFAGSIDEGSKTIVEYCVSVATFGFLIASSTFLFTVTIGIVLASLMLKKQPFRQIK